MTDCLEESKCLASLAVFRELYNSKKDIYEIISEFLKEVILSESMHQFNLTKITNLVNSTFDFQLPEAIVKTALNKIKFIKKANGFFIAKNLANQKKTIISDSQNRFLKNNTVIIDQLYLYIQEKQNSQLSENQKIEILHSFCSYLLDKTYSQKYSEFINTFIIEKRNDFNFTNQINNIREGVVLYTGLKYNNINETGNWNKDLTIFLDTEILFHFAGYNGEIFKNQFNDFFSLIKEINRKANKKIIKLKYFKEVKNEIEMFFKKAEFIIEGKEIINSSVIAMETIIVGCKFPADVILKKTKFFELLAQNSIYEDDNDDYYKKENHKYNISDQNIIDKYLKDYKKNDLLEALKFLNYIYILRRNEMCKFFEDIQYILLTGKHTTLKISHISELKELIYIPLAIDLNFITNKFWFKLNKGFGKDSYPKTFDVVVKAQIILSTQLNEIVSTNYDKLCEEYKKGDISKSVAISTIANLRSIVRKPEEIEEDNVSMILETITENNIEKYIEEQEHFKNLAQKESSENIKLKNQLNLKDSQLSELEIRHRNEQIEKQKSITETKKMLISEKSYNFDLLQHQKSMFDNVAKRKYILLKITLIFTIILFYAIFVFIFFKIEWSLIESIAYLIGPIPFLISILYLLKYEKIFDPLDFLKKKKINYFTAVYEKNNFDISKLELLEKEINNLKNEILSN